MKIETRLSAGSRFPYTGELWVQVVPWYRSTGGFPHRFGNRIGMTQDTGRVRNMRLCNFSDCTTFLVDYFLLFFLRRFYHDSLFFGHRQQQIYCKMYRIFARNRLPVLKPCYGLSMQHIFILKQTDYGVYLLSSLALDTAVSVTESPPSILASSITEPS